MAEWLRQSTAVTLKIGPFVDETDAKTPETALTLTQADFRLSKNGADMAQKNEASSGVHDEGGWYDVAINATDTDTPGRLLVSVQEAGALPLWQEYMVVPQQVWDSLFASDRLQVHAAEISNDLITAASIATDAVTEIQSGLSTFNVSTDQVNLLTATQASIDAIETDTNSLNDTKVTTTRANNLDNLDATVSSRSTFDDTTDSVIVDMTTALPGSPTADTVGDALKRSSVGVPLSAAGASGGLATYNDVNVGVIFGTVNDGAATAGSFIGNSALEGTTDNYYRGRFLIFVSNDLGARKITSYTAASRTFTFGGTSGQDADAPFDAAPANGSSFIIFGFHGA